MTTMTKTREIPALWQKFIAAGWVHVTGLPAINGGPFETEMILPYPDLSTGIGRNNGKTVAYLDDGSVWITKGYRSPPTFPGANGGASSVPLSNGEDVDANHILERIADPFWNGGSAKRHGPGLPPEGKELGYVQNPATIGELCAHPAMRDRVAQAIQAGKRVDSRLIQIVA